MNIKNAFCTYKNYINFTAKFNSIQGCQIFTVKITTNSSNNDVYLIVALKSEKYISMIPESAVQVMFYTHLK